jgi:hypothetical protein
VPLSPHHRPGRALTGVLAVALTLPQLAGCSGAPSGAGGPRPPEWNPSDETKCKVAKSQSRPLIVEWPSSDRVALESTMKDGLAAVRAVGCEVEVLSHCRVPGRYGYRGTSKESDAVSIFNEDDLYANLPLGAASLSGKLRSSGSLSVSMAVVGRYVVEEGNPGSGPLQGQDCERATHYISAVSVGAFTLAAGGAQEAGGGVDLKVVGGGARTASKREELKSGGNVASCEAASRKDTEPPEGCGALLRIELIPMPSRGAARVAPVPTATATDPPLPAPTPTSTARSAPVATARPSAPDRSHPTPATKAPAQGSPLLVGSLYMTSFGLLGLLVGGLGATGAKKTAEEECDDRGICTQKGADARKTGRTMALIANVGAGVTALGIGLLIVLPKPKPTAPSTALGIGGQGVHLLGEF